ncbi:MAG: response regulator [Elainellaceae cyanobacterium]
MSKTILIVEDEAEIAHLLQHLLEREGFTCIHYRDGAQALQFFPEHQPDLVILDLGLPGMDSLSEQT